METLLSAYYTKSIRLTPDGFSLFRQTEGGGLERQDCPAGENALLTTLAPGFFGLCADNMQTIDVIVGTHVPMLVPDVIYDESRARDCLAMQFDLTHYGQHFSDTVGHYRSLYFLTRNEYTTVNQLPCIPHFVSECSLFYRFLRGRGEPEAMLLTVNDGYVDVMAVHGGEPSFVNRLTRTGEVDVLYYTLNGAQQFALESPTLFVQYFNKTNKKLNDLLVKYHPKVVFL